MSIAVLLMEDLFWVVHVVAHCVDGDGSVVQLSTHHRFVFRHTICQFSTVVHQRIELESPSYQSLLCIPYLLDLVVDSGVSEHVLGAQQELLCSSLGSHHPSCHADWLLGSGKSMDEDAGEVGRVDPSDDVDDPDLLWVYCCREPQL